MLFTIVTPCRNAADLLAETVDSVLCQTALSSGRAQLQYVIVDGASTDRTLEIAKSYQHPSVEIISGPDSGMYDALAKGFANARGDIIAYLNAGDYYHKTAFDVVLDIMQSGVPWLTGFRVAYNSRSQVVQVKEQRPFRREFFENGYYGGEPFSTVQQESTFWRRELLAEVDLQKLRTFRLAGDFFLWQTFRRKYPLVAVDAHLGGYRIHQGQLSEDAAAYRREVAIASRPPTWREKLTAYCDLHPAGLLSRLLVPFSFGKMVGDAYYFHPASDAWRPYR